MRALVQNAAAEVDKNVCKTGITLTTGRAKAAKHFRDNMGLASDDTVTGYTLGL